jgi:hypothetical protein
MRLRFPYLSIEFLCWRSRSRFLRGCVLWGDRLKKRDSVESLIRAVRSNPCLFDNICKFLTESFCDEPDESSANLPNHPALFYFRMGFPHRWSRSGLFFGTLDEFPSTDSGTKECRKKHRQLETQCCCSDCRACSGCGKQSDNSIAPQR